MSSYLIGGGPAVVPPSTGMTIPVTWAERSLPRYTAASAMSRVLPVRWSGWRRRITACVSSQVGCSLACKFCATARLKRQRNLSPDEIYDQVVAIKEQAQLYFNRPLTNIVFMGMGEPLLNYANVISAIDKITSQKGLNMANKRITVSTVGIAKMIVKMADDNVKFNHAPHIRANVECATCHGDVAQQTVAQRSVEHTMGFCVNCHNERQASVDCLTCHF